MLVDFAGDMNIGDISMDINTGDAINTANTNDIANSRSSLDIRPDSETLPSLSLVPVTSRKKSRRLRAKPRTASTNDCDAPSSAAPTAPP